MHDTLELDRVYEAMGFRCAPFRITPDTSFFFPHSQYLAALSHLRYGVMSGGITLLTGEVGLGKTLLCRCFMRQMSDQNVRTAYVFNPNQSYASLLTALFRDLTGVTPPVQDEGALHALLYQTLMELAKNRTRVALIVDEAHALSPTLLEGLRLLSNLETEERKLISLLLFGQNEMEDTLALPTMRALKQRIAVWHRLRPFGWLETSEYVLHRINSARIDSSFRFSRLALLAIRHYSKGVPRRINQICDRAVLLAFARGLNEVGLHMLREAALDVLGFASVSP
jgi:general secretion pathway protein A